MRPLPTSSFPWCVRLSLSLKLVQVPSLGAGVVFLGKGRCGENNEVSATPCEVDTFSLGQHRIFFWDSYEFGKLDDQEVEILNRVGGGRSSLAF